jgi:ribA/ribD-fused uncharacterized protein
MKLIIFLLLICCNCFAETPEQEIPHYKIYPRTPIVDYDAEILDFYSVKEYYGEFSNFALFPITIDGIIWPSSEHYYQAHKFLDLALQERVRLAPTPYLAAQMARDPSMPLRDDWDDIKDSVMLTALRAKFSQYKLLQDLLRSTHNAHLFEHTKNDCYWADCGDHSGKNRLGEELMEIRTELLSSP